MCTTTPDRQGSARLFGREPAFWVGVIEAVLALVLSFNALGLDAQEIGGIMAVVVALSGVYVAYVTRDTMLGVLVGLAKAIIIGMAAFQVDLTEAQTTSVIAIVAIFGGAFNRSQTGPALYGSFSDPTPAEETPVVVQQETTAYGASVEVGHGGDGSTRYAHQQRSVPPGA